MRKIAIFFIAVAALLLLGATPALANGIPKLPHAFYGSVTVNGAPAPGGTQVSARVNIGEIISTQNPVTTSGGSYGVSSSYLLVQGYDIPDGATITFHVTNANGTAAGGTATFIAGGGPSEMNLTVTIAAPAPLAPSGGGGGGPAAQAPIQVDVFGTTATLEIDSEGVVQETFTATTADGKLTITIEEGTVALDAEGNPLGSLEAAVNPSPPDPPEGAHIIGLAYEFGPDGATFTPPIILEFTVEPGDIPAGLTIDDMVLAYYDEGIGEWVEIPTSVVPGTNILRASVSHFTTFAIIGTPKPAAFSLSSLVIEPAEIAPGEEVNISMSVANTGGVEGSYTVILKINGVKEVEKSVTVTAASSQTVSFSVAKEEAGSYSVTVDGLSGSFSVVAPPPAPEPTPAPAPEPTPPPPTPPAPEITAPVTPPPPTTNWGLIGGLIAGGIVIIALLIFFLVRRRAY